MKKLGICVSLSLLLVMPAMADDPCVDPDPLLEVGCAWAAGDTDYACRLMAVRSVSGDWPAEDCKIVAPAWCAYPGAVAGHPSDWPRQYMPWRAWKTAETTDQTLPEAFHGRALARIEKCAAECGFGADVLARTRRHVETWVTHRIAPTAPQIYRAGQHVASTPEGEALRVGRLIWMPDAYYLSPSRDLERGVMARAAGRDLNVYDLRLALSAAAALRAEIDAGRFSKPPSDAMRLLGLWEVESLPPRPPVLGCPPREICPPPCEPDRPPEDVPLFDFQGQKVPIDGEIYRPEIASHDPALQLYLTMDIVFDVVPTKKGDSVAFFYVVEPGESEQAQNQGDVLSVTARVVKVRKGKPIHDLVVRAGPGCWKSKPDCPKKMKETKKIFGNLRPDVEYTLEVQRDADDGLTVSLVDWSLDGTEVALVEMGAKAAPGLFQVDRFDTSHEPGIKGEVVTFATVSAGMTAGYREGRTDE